MKMDERVRSRLWLAAVCCLAFSSGCARYVPPGRGADLRSIGLAPEAASQTDASIREALARRPLAKFPTNLAVVRIQAPEYCSPTARGWGHGRYSIVTTRDVESDAQFERLEHMPEVRALARLSRLLFTSSHLKSDVELRAAAAGLQADMLLVYTLDTTFYTEDAAVPLTVISLGLSPNRQAHAITTASGAFVGTHNGYIYGLAEVTARHDRIASAWTDSEAIDAARRKTESESFEKLVMELQRTWADVVREYASQPTR